jgi:hypothetical protein
VGAAVAAVAVVAVVGSLVGTGRVTVGPSHAAGSWRALPTPPLSPRAEALAVWTGKEVVVVGGDSRPCAPNADCAYQPDALLRDGAAYDPATHAWHKIAPAPVRTSASDRLVTAAGRVLLAHWHRGRISWFVYDPVANQWFGIPAAGTPSAVGDRVYGLRQGRVVMYDAARGLWHERIPRDPIRPRLTHRQVTATPTGPVVTGYDATRPDDGSVADVVLVDVYDGTAWHRLPATDQVGNNTWSWTGTQLVDPEVGTLDGGQVDSWDRRYPVGGRLDPASGRWSALPPAFGSETDDGWAVEAAGGQWVATSGLLYDTATGRVATLSRPAGAPSYDVTAAWAGGSLLVFGGAGDESDQLSGKPSNRAWLYTP